jgi:hypothetical protein
LLRRAKLRILWAGFGVNKCALVSALSLVEGFVGNAEAAANSDGVADLLGVV